MKIFSVQRAPEFVPFKTRRTKYKTLIITFILILAPASLQVCNHATETVGSYLMTRPTFYHEAFPRSLSVFGHVS